MGKIRWWANDPSEKYWLEGTDRADIGANLRAPSLNEGGKEEWHYSLFTGSRVGDIVIHYHKKQGLIGHSRIAGPPTETLVTWRPRGRSGRERKGERSPRPGYEIPLDSFARLEPPITLYDIRAAEPEILRLVSELKQDNKPPLYFPFEIGRGRPIRPHQGYAFKLPKGFLNIFPRLAASLVEQDLLGEQSPLASIGLANSTSGQGYGLTVAERRAVEDRAMKAAARYFESKEYKVKNVSKSESFDLVVHNSTERLTVEVKGTVTGGRNIFLTKNEVQHAKTNTHTHILFVLHSIELENDESEPRATGGIARVFWPWVIDDADLEAEAYSYRLL